MQIERVLVERAVVALMAALTPQRHLALRVTTEQSDLPLHDSVAQRRGGCGYQRCAPSCVEHRELIAELWAVLEGGQSDATHSTRSGQAKVPRGERSEGASADDRHDPATAKTAGGAG